MTIAACSAVDPGVDGLTRAQLGIDAAAPPNKDGGPIPPGKDGSVTDSGGQPDTSVATTDAFTGTGAYASQLPANSAVSIHANKGVGVVPGKGVACLSCHGNGGSAPEFLFGGTVFKDKAGTLAAANIELRVRGSDGMGFLSHSDMDGNFWFLKGASVLATPALTGARNSATTTLMSGNITDTNCNGCHTGGGTDVVHLP